MVSEGECTCPRCGGELKHNGRVKRIVRTKGSEVRWINVRRLVCLGCGCIHRELPDYLFSYKHYVSETIIGVVKGEITAYDLEYEDYPCEGTMKGWKLEFGGATHHDKRKRTRSTSI